MHKPELKNHANKVSERYKTTKWMVYNAIENGEKCIILKCVDKLQFYGYGNRNDQLQKFSQYWRSISSKMQMIFNGKRVRQICVSSPQTSKSFNLKALYERGAKLFSGTKSLKTNLLVEFECVRSADVK